MTTEVHAQRTDSAAADELIVCQLTETATEELTGMAYEVDQAIAA